MNEYTELRIPGYKQFSVRRCLQLVTVLIGVLAAGSTQALSLNVMAVNSDGTTSELLTGYRWLIEEDVTFNVVPGQTCQAGQEADCPSVNFHKSYLPVIAEGHSSDPLPNDLNNNKRYYVSVLPDAGFSMGGAQVAASAGSVTVYVNEQPIPTAQIRIFVFNDNFPINGEPDTPEELGLGGFNVLLEDAGGRYGISGQQITTDAFGNPLGSTYDGSGNLLTTGDGTVRTDANGIALIKNLVPAKYGIQAVPPTTDASGSPTSWIQTTTLEGKKIIDAWVQANEPPYFTEFGPPGPHVFMGFVEQFAHSDLSGGATITGQVRSIHNSRPPDFAFYTGAPVPGCWVGLNNLAVGRGQGLYAAPCNDDSTFSIPNVPDGSYQLAIWDKHLDYIFGAQAITVENGNCNGGSCDLLDVPVFAWFGRIEQHVFNDLDEDGFLDGGEEPLFEEGTALRWRDGTIYQAFPTDLSGAAPYDEVFPFFSWLVAEVGFGRNKATGVTVIVDDGGAIESSDPWSFDGVLNPQPQTINNGGESYRTETGPVLTQGVQTFLGQTNIIQWGKKPYDAGENGGISGIVYYAVTRAENDPAYAAPELWEPGIPRIQVALYADSDLNGMIDDLNGDGCQTVADVDNYPVGFATSGGAGPEDFKYVKDTNAPTDCEFIRDTSGNLDFNAGDAIDITTTDSWDDNLPEDCEGESFLVNGNVPVDCYDGLRVFNQVRPAVFDGGYAFDGLLAGNYIVGTGEHAAYKTLREEDRNVDFGEEFTPDPNLLPPECVGNPHTVANEFSLFPLFDEDGVTPVAPFMAGSDTPLCDRKKVRLNDRQNAAADFFMFTHVPVAAKVTGFILDDTANEFDPNAPTFGEKYSPPYLPVSIRDWTGREFGRTYSDRWGTFNTALPSTYTTNVASSSGMSPNMVTTCMNDPGPIPNPSGGFMTDPNYNPQYSQFCYTFQYMPGVTTFLDTPVVPIAAFTGPAQEPLDCREEDGTPVIASVLGSMSGPYVSTTQGAGTANNPYVADGTQSITITAAVDPSGRDIGFGNNPGVVTIGGVSLTNASIQWSAGSITGLVAAGTQTGQLQITRDNGVSTVAGITVTVGGGAIQVSPGGSIQQAIDLAAPGGLVLVPPGDFEELVIMHKPVRLQGSGALTTISAIKSPATKLAQWRLDVQSLQASGAFSLLPAQEVILAALGDPALLQTEEGPAIIVLGVDGAGGTAGRSFAKNKSRIDGFSITGADHAGGIVVNGYATNLVMSNNRVFGNNGIYSGGIRVGHPELALEQGNNLSYQDGFNDNIQIHHNVITQNAGNGGAGGGISLYHGSDGYAVTRNKICGNFSLSDGGGIGHYGFSGSAGNGNAAHAPLIANNTVIFNQTFTQLGRPSGGGIFVGGAPGFTGGLSDGSGSVQIRSNLVQGNQAGAGDGGGIAAVAVHGDLQGGNPNGWGKLEIVNNIIVNNMAGMAGGGISLRDTVVVDIINNTIAHNDSTATAGDAFNVPGNANVSSPQPAGLVSFAHSTALEGQIPNNRKAAYGSYAKPALINNIIWRNRSFYFEIDRTQEPAVFGLLEAPLFYQDLAVDGGAGLLNPQYCLLTDASSYPNANIDGEMIEPGDLFEDPYVNTGNGETIQQVELTTTIATQPAFDEGGNFIQVRFGPLAPTGDYHLFTGAAAIDAGTNVMAPATDIDGDSRLNNDVDIGADEAG